MGKLFLCKVKLQESLLVTLGFHPEEHACLDYLQPTNYRRSPLLQSQTVHSAQCSFLLVKQTLWISINNLFSTTCSFWFSKNLPFTICFSFIFTLHLLFYFPSFTLQSFIVLLTFSCSRSKMSQLIAHPWSQRCTIWKPKVSAIQKLLPVQKVICELWWPDLHDKINKWDFRSLLPWLQTFVWIYKQDIPLQMWKYLF